MPSSPARQTASAALPGQEQSRQPRPADSDLFLYCCVCFQPLSSPPARATDGEDDDQNLFWLTSCGHITCTAHIFPGGAPVKAARSKHNCPYCQCREVSITRLGVGETPPYLQDYFRPTNELLNDFCGAMTFQYNNLQRAATHFRNLAQDYRERTEKHRVVLKGVRDELAMVGELKKENESLKEELDKLRSILHKYETRPGQGVQGSSNTLSEPKPAPQACLSSPQPAIPQKRKSPHQGANTSEDSAALERGFREEINARQAMPPPRVKTLHGRNSVEGIVPNTAVYQRDSQRQLTNSYTPIQKPGRGRDSRHIDQPEHTLYGNSMARERSLTEYHRQEEQISDNARHTRQSGSQLDRTMHMGSAMRYYPLSPSTGTSIPSQRSRYTAASQRAPPTPSRPSFSRSVNASFQPPTLSHPPQRISPFMDGLISRGGGGSLRLSTAETSKSVYKSNRSSSPLERLSLPPKPVTRNPPRSSSRQNPPCTPLSSPFFREQVSSGGTHSSHTLRESSRSVYGRQDVQSRGFTNYGKELNLAYETPNFSTISLDSGGLFRRESLSRSDPDFRLVQER